MSKLAYLREDAAMEVQSLFDEFELSDNRDEMISLVKGLCHNFHIIGTAGLLVDGDPEKLFLNACRAGENWRRLLVLCREKKWKLPSASYNAPLLGAVLAGNRPLASSIADLSEIRWQAEEGEYEDEFYLASIYQSFFNTEPERERIKSEYLPRLKEIGQGELAIGLEAIECLFEKDEIGFLEAFKDAVSDREDLVEKRAAGFGTPVVAFSVKRHLWFEGLALLKLGQWEGFQHRGGFLYCPPLAREEMTVEYTNDWVLTLDEELAS